VVDLVFVDREGGVMAAETLFIGSLVIVGICRIEYNTMFKNGFNIDKSLGETETAQ